MNKNTRNSMYSLLLTIAAMMMGQGRAWASSTFSVTNADNIFTITRTETVEVETVNYRTVSLSALAGKHFTEATGSLEFAVGESEKMVTVTETAIGDISRRQPSVTSKRSTATRPDYCAATASKCSTRPEP